MTQVWGRCALMGMLLGICIVGVAQEKSSKRSTKSTKSSKVAEKDQVVSGRLPRYFASIVDDEQRVEIYEIQADYQEKIAELEKQLAELEEAQMKEIEGVLTSTQRKTLGSLRDAAGENGSSKSTKTSSSTSSSRTPAKKASSTKSSSAKSTKAKKASAAKSADSEE